MKPKCYSCKHRGMVAGSAHSSCHHPALEKVDDNTFGAMAQMIRGEFNEAVKKLEIQGHPQGIRGGWFMWPANFDPTWLINCNGYEEKNAAPQKEEREDSCGEQHIQDNLDRC